MTQSTITKGLLFFLTLSLLSDLAPGYAQGTPPAKPIAANSDAEQGRTVVLDDIFFGFDKVDVKPEQEKVLEWLVLHLVKNPDKKVLIEGHTDSLGPDNYNRILSQKRAYAVSKVLTNAGIDSDRIRMRWFGETQPQSEEDTSEGRAKNRRVEIKVY